MIVALIIINILRGKGDGSGAGVVKCSRTDWFLFAVFIAIGLVITAAAVIVIKKEFTLK
jgi:hypothetical protein